MRRTPFATAAKGYRAPWNGSTASWQTCSGGWNVLDQVGLDRAMVRRDGTPDKGRLGANAILSVSLAAARAAAAAAGLPLYRYLGGPGAVRLPLPMMNILNGGAHAANNVEIQEFMVVPVGAASFREGLHLCVQVFHALKAVLAEQGTPAAGVGDEGGYAPNLASDEAALEAILAAGERAGYAPGRDFRIALDCAVSDWYNPKEDRYVMKKSGQAFRGEELLERWQSYADRYPICSIEDGMGEDDWSGWQALTARLGAGLQLVGDDLFVTNPERLRTGIGQRAANAILIKPNQIGTLSETLETVALAKAAGYGVVLSHRSGETTDPFLADLAVAAGCGQIKAGAPAGGAGGQVQPAPGHRGGAERAGLWPAAAGRMGLKGAKKRPAGEKVGIHRAKSGFLGTADPV